MPDNLNSEFLRCDEVPLSAQISRLFSDGTAAGILLRNVVDYRTTEINLENAFVGNTVEIVATAFAEVLSRARSDVLTSRWMSFQNAHGWHLATLKGEPRLRLWGHIRGTAAFSAVRAKSLTVTTGQYGEESDVLEHAYGLPVTHNAMLGDAIVFIDSGDPMTGPSTFHKVDAEGDTRLGVSVDLILR